LAVAPAHRRREPARRAAGADPRRRDGGAARDGGRRRVVPDRVAARPDGAARREAGALRAAQDGAHAVPAVAPGAGAAERRLRALVQARIDPPSGDGRTGDMRETTVTALLLTVAGCAHLSEPERQAALRQSLAAVDPAAEPRPPEDPPADGHPRFNTEYWLG